MPSPYSTEADVYLYSGLSSALIQTVTGKSPAEVTTLITEKIAKADSKIRNAVRVPIIVHRELHVADGEKRVFLLGPEDENLDLFDYNATSEVQEVFAVYIDGVKTHMPYPKDCYSQTNNNASDYSTSNCAITGVANSVAPLRVGTYYLSCVYSAAGYIQYPSAGNLNKNIHYFSFASFILQTDNASRKFTLYLYNVNGNANMYEFSLPKANMRFIVSINLNSMTGSVDWSDNNMYYWRLYSDGACTVQLDGFNFNDGFMWTYPYGELIYTETDELSTGEGNEGMLGEGVKLHVTYSFDPFLSSTPEYIKSASARLAGAYLWDHMKGFVQAKYKLELSGDTEEPIPQRDVMERTIQRLINEAKEDIAEYGYGYVGGVV